MTSRDMTSAAVLLTEVLICILISNALWKYLTSPIRHIPGPLVARFSNAWRLVDAWRGTTDATHRALHKRYGPAVRIGPKCVILSDPAMIKTIYSTRPALNKSDFYSAGDAVTHGQRTQTQFTTRIEEWHDYLVRPIKGSYSLSHMLSFEPLLDKTLDYFEAKLQREYARDDAPMSCPIGDLLHLFAWDVLGEVTFSERLGALDGEAEVQQLIRNVERAINYMAVIGQMPSLDPILKNPVWPLGPPGFEFAGNYAAERLKERVRTGQHKTDSDHPKDFIDIFIEAEKSEAGEGQVTRRQISWMILNTVAGSDTTAAALRAIVYHVARSESVRQKLTSELRQAYAQQGQLDFKTCRQLSYLDAVIKESLRISPPIGLPLERVVSSAGLSLPDGRTLPEGTIVGINPSVVNHSDVFGADTDHFVPERWLRGDGESDAAFAGRIAHMKDADLTFGFGKRECIGKNLAVLEVYKTIARLFADFDITLVDPEKEWTVVNGWFVRQYGIDVHLRKHTPSAEGPQ